MSRARCELQLAILDACVAQIHAQAGPDQKPTLHAIDGGR